MKRGSAIIAVLMLVSMFFVMGVAMLSSQSMAYRGAAQARAGQQALALAQAGLEDARSKLEKDPFFPPPGALDQKSFTYTEDLTDLDGKAAGRYQVTIDRTRAAEPYLILTVTSVGIQGEGTENSARKRLTAELDVSKTLRTDPTLKNPNCYRILRVNNEE